MTIPPRNVMLRNSLILLGAFLLGLLPPLVRTMQLKAELANVQERIRLAGTRNLAALTHLEVSRNNFGAASLLASRMFESIEAVHATSDQDRSALNRAMSKRDNLMGLLARADPASRVEVQEIVELVSVQAGSGHDVPARAK